MKRSMAIGFGLAALCLALAPAWSEDDGAGAAPPAKPAPPAAAPATALVKPAAADSLLASLEPTAEEIAASGPKTAVLAPPDTGEAGAGIDGLGSASMQARMSHPALPGDLDAPIPQPKQGKPGEPASEGFADGDTPAIDLATLPPPLPEPFRINEAGAEELARVLGLDARRARILLAYRKVHGPFREPEDVAQVHGITDEQTLAWEAAGLLHFDRD